MLQEVVNRTHMFSLCWIWSSNLQLEFQPQTPHQSRKRWTTKKQKDVLRIRFHVERLYYTRNHNTSKTEICCAFSASPNASKQRLGMTFRPPNLFRNHVTQIHGLLFFQQIIGHSNFQAFFSMVFGERNLQFDAVLRPGSFRGNRHVSIDGDGNQMTHLKTWSLRGSQILKILELDHCSFAGIWLSGYLSNVQNEDEATCFKGNSFTTLTNEHTNRKKTKEARK